MSLAITNGCLLKIELTEGHMILDIRSLILGRRVIPGGIFDGFSYSNGQNRKPQQQYYICSRTIDSDVVVRSCAFPWAV